MVALAGDRSARARVSDFCLAPAGGERGCLTRRLVERQSSCAAIVVLLVAVLVVAREGAGLGPTPATAIVRLCGSAARTAARLVARTFWPEVWLSESRLYYCPAGQPVNHDDYGKWWFTVPR